MVDHVYFCIAFVVLVPKCGKEHRKGFHLARKKISSIYTCGCGKNLETAWSKMKTQFVTLGILLLSALQVSNGQSPPCSAEPLEIIWLLSESRSVGAIRFDKVKNYVVNTAHQLRIWNSLETCHGAVEYGYASAVPDPANIIIPVTCGIDFDTTAINTLQFTARLENYVKSTMEYMADIYFPANRKPSPDWKRMMVVFMDSPSLGEDENGQVLVNATNRAIEVGDVDRLVYIAINEGSRAPDYTLFDGVGIYNATLDRIIKPTYDVFEISDITNRVCFNKPQQNPTLPPITGTPTTSPTPKPTQNIPDSGSSQCECRARRL